jgi:PDZ domain-containing secreted protein
MTSTGAPERGRRRTTWIITACAACAVAGGVIGGVIANAINSPSSTSSASTASTAAADNAKNGLREGDIVTTIDGQPATSTDQLVMLTLTKHPGDTVQLGYQRDGRQGTATVTLASTP